MVLSLKKECLEKPFRAQLISKYDDDYCPDNVVGPIVVSDASCIADGILHDLTDYHATLIESPPGFGKTWFILHEILPRVLQDGKKLLLVSNRIAVSYQQKLEVMRLLNDDQSKYLTEAGIVKKEDFGPVKIMTLQALEPYLRSEEGIAYSREVAVLCVDECQYFTTDYFSPSAPGLLQKIPQLFKAAVRIYMTATPEDVLVPLAEAEDQISRTTKERLGIRPSPCLWGERPSIYWYQFVNERYCNLPVKYYKEANDLCNQIKASNQDGWLIFVQSKVEGESLKKQLGKDAKFISAEKKETSDWENMLKNEKLPCRVLIATSVIDCGVNICDEKLRHVVVPFEDHALFIQALGRKRFIKEPKFTLYVRAITQNRLNSLVSQNNRLLSLAAQIEQTNNYNLALEKMFYDATQEERFLLNRGNNGRWGLNRLYIHKLRRQKQFYQQLQKYFDQYGEAAFPRIVHQWLGQPDAYDKSNWIGKSAIKVAKSDLDGIIAKYNGIPLSTEDDQQKFGCKLDSCYSVICGKSKRTDRNDGKYGHVQLKKHS